MIDDEYILNKFFNKLNKISFQAIVHATKEELNYLNNRYKDSDSIKETLNRIKYNIEERPVCEICGRPVRFLGKKNHLFYRTCSRECRKKYNSITSSNLVYNKTLSVLKAQQTKFEKYGDINYNNRNKARQTNIKKYGVTSYAKTDECKEKTKHTNLKKYGVEYAANLDTNIFKSNNPQKNPIIKEKTRQTNIQKYGGPSPTCNKNVYKKQRNTIKEKYGVDYFTQSEEFKLLMSTLHDVIQEKTIKTNLEKHNVERTVFLDETKQKLKATWENKTEQELQKIVQKIHNTKRKNNSFNISKQEEFAYILLLSAYPDIIRQFCDENRYPFNCDFYIPSKDLFIECNFHWTHGGHPYNEESDINKLELWKSKNTKFYNNAINTWTKRDVEKRKIAKENNLNYIEFWNINDIYTIL